MNDDTKVGGLKVVDSSGFKEHSNAIPVFYAKLPDVCLSLAASRRRFTAWMRARA